MGKYSSSSRRPPAPKRDQIHPLVRGIGCLMFVLVPILAYGIATLVVPMTGRWGLPVPPEWYGPANIQNPATNVPYLSDFFDLILKQDNLVVNVIFALIITVVLYGVLSILYGYVYSMAAPSRLGPTDVPQPRVKTKKYRR
jgi:hypothetical protein